MTDPSGGLIAVADADPLIHLDELGVLGLLADFAEVWVPEAVWQELERHRPTALRDTPLRWIKCNAPVSERVIALSALYTLHSGEQEALALCLRHPGVLLLTDDTAARLAAQNLAIRAHGTLGLLLRAMRRRQLPKAAVLALLQQVPDRSSLHIRPGLLHDIILQVAETPEPSAEEPL